MSKMLKPKSLLLLMFALVMAFTTACSSGGDNSASEKEEDKPAEEVKLTQDQPGWEVDTSPITFDWYINFAWFPNKWGEDITSQYVTKKTGVNGQLHRAGRERSREDEYDDRFRHTA